jgi:hypothetical protein
MNPLAYAAARAGICSAVLLLTLAGCAGDLNPSLFPAGASGSGATSGGGATSGAAGSGASSPPCDAPTVTFPSACALVGCHDSTSMLSGLDLTAAGIVARVLNVTPGAASQACGPPNPSSMEPYLRQGSNPATGLLIDKLVPASVTCGVLMPYGNQSMIDPTDFSCITSWATAVTTGVITQ